jgi:peptide-methionine (S)-S-oxide reductase
MDKKIETAVFGGGCFWCTEAVFENLKGVESVMPGYAGGSKPNPTYEDICKGNSGHAEVTKVEYDPSVISYRDLLTVFFATHDPTTRNRQGYDVGTEYRSIILITTPEQKTEAEAIIKEIDSSNPDGMPVVTEVKPLETFYPAEEYHREYYKRNSGNGYCQLIINPKLKKVQEKFSQLLKQQSQTEN